MNESEGSDAITEHKPWWAHPSVGWLLSGCIIAVAVWDIAGWRAVAVFLGVMVAVAVAIEVVAKVSRRAVVALMILVTVGSLGWFFSMVA